MRARLPDFKFPIRFIVALLQALDAIAVKLKKDKDADMSSLLQTVACSKSSYMQLSLTSSEGWSQKTSKALNQMKRLVTSS